MRKNKIHAIIDNMKAIIHTSKGDITCELFPERTPLTVANFKALALGEKEWVNPTTGMRSNDPLYKGLIFHRVIEGFMIQTGCPLGTGTGGPGYRFGDEIDPELSFAQPYVLGMANAGPGTNGSQFFITQVPTTWLNGRHTVFGKVVDEESKAVVDAIAGVATNAQDRPLEDIILQSIEIVE